ncbi:hydrogenase isoenzyme formation protein HypC [Helicobacter cinaedi PAGU611]|uniref:Hydrogenase assembly chaperone HypC/HupF n=1 Tax=Helicobacter cinaedi CCUG 18818 = ATCC BAA-847 TaxID=537971 RepID=A0AAI8QGC3_9HELI|nr:HypC/HybG/HupF family hydrogenase formation chaperone [Helicobacter cinaedi]AWK61366.1 HypC/HybG/HupF family hydrogenase formation chaperone [Helicobacter cinaedi]EFR46367.1 hydrogenase assembly chaperone HypC/HupF [Helicobacter cinaedi CCUG 18818 = ATCC BAA-847]QOQ90048.1 HypC/HybG/HupF family hydrogenase formation chaperone [Helicobacter cinaedi]QOQ96230.1 HypC/HybG/HupF family hydrogenase formation chaperone [Helicobacter cinaedi]BAM11826.1 hydrogenase isoenzyme formation protein HypC [H
MCLAIPSKVVELKENNVAVVDTLGVRREASLDLLDESVSVGEWVLLHIGFVMSKIDELSAMESLRLYDEILKAMQEEDEALLNANGGVRE